MPVTCVAVVVIPNVANGARRQAWNASTSMDPSGMRGLARERADLRQQVGGQRDAVALGALAVAAAALARQAHALVFRHRRDQRLDAREIGLPARERCGVDRDERLADARR